MPKGSSGQKRPADSIGCAVSVSRIATGEQEDTTIASPNRRKSGLTGVQARMEKMDKETRLSVAQKATDARWSNPMFTDENLMSRVYDGEAKVTNLKLFPGTDRDTTPAEVLEEVDRVISELENGALQVIELED